MRLAPVVAVLLLLPAVALAFRNANDDEDILPTWGGQKLPPADDPMDLQQRQSKMKVLDAEARIFMFENFYSDEECDHIVQMSEKHLERSGVVKQEGGSEISEIRTSKGVFLDRGQDEIIRRIEERIAAWTLVPAGHGEGLQVLKYDKSQKYDAHWDYFFDKESVQNGGNRYATVLAYLADTEEGGETVFPNIPAPGGVNVGFSECAKYHLAVKPKKGTAVLFHSIKPTGELEKKSLHTACPVIKGVKWSAAKWIHVGHYAMGGERMEYVAQHPDPLPKGAKVPGACEDEDDMCGAWAESGECERNPTFMIGTRGRPGKCLQACRRCDLVATTGAEQIQQGGNSYSDEGTRRRAQASGRKTGPN